MPVISYFLNNILVFTRFYLIICDVTSLTVAHSDERILEQQMNHDLCEIHTWLIANKLSLNVIKTKYMIVASQYGTKPLSTSLIFM